MFGLSLIHAGFLAAGLAVGLPILIHLLLALLFARPYWDESYRRGLETEIVLLLDRSASMSAKDSAGQTAFASALQQAREELQRVEDNVIVHLALCDATAVKEIPVDDLAAAETTAAATDFGLALSW